LVLGRYGIFTGDVANAKAGDWCAVGIKEQLFGCRIFRGAAFEVGLEGNIRKGI